MTIDEFIQTLMQYRNDYGNIEVMIDAIDKNGDEDWRKDYGIRVAALYNPWNEDDFENVVLIFR